MADVSIVIVDGPNQGREFELSGATVVGRDQSAGLVVDDAEASRRHASLSVEGDILTVEDLGSTNGTFVNGGRISAATTLKQGDKLRIGTTVFEVHVAAPAEDEVQATRVGTALPDLDDLQVTAPRNVPSFAQEDATAEQPAEPEPESVAPEPIQPTAAGIPQPPAPTNAPPPGPPGGPPPGGPPPPGPGPSAPPPAFAPPPPAPVGGPPAPYAGGGGISAGGYPITVEADYPQNGIARWRVFFQGLLAFPHFFVLFFVAIGLYFALIGAWFSILFTRRYPPGIFNFASNTLRWSTRVTGYIYWMTEEYPPFNGQEAPYPIRAQFQYPEGGIARWRVFFQGLLAIPHFIVLGFLGIGVYIALIWAWFSILFTKQYPPAAFNFILGVMRWQIRVQGYSLWMTEQYPPFSLE